MENISIVIPGLLGSQLSFKNALSRDTVYWIDRVLIARDGFLPMALDVDGKKPFPGKGLKLTPDDFFGDFYGALRNRLKAGLPAEWKKQAFVYDFRLNPALAAAELSSAILQQQGNGNRFYLVGHSLGGLVAKLAWSNLKDQGKESLVKRIVTLGSPHYGSYSVSEAYNLRDSTTNDLARLSGMLSLSGLANRATQEYRTRVKDDVLRTINTWPSIYALMPMSGSLQQQYDPDVSKWYVTENLPSDLWIDRDWMSWTQNTFQTTYHNTLSLPPREVLKCVAGTGHTTIQSLQDPAKLTNFQGYNFSDEGDGVVACWSALGMSTNRETVKCEHALLPQNPVILEKIIGWLTDDVVPEPQTIEKSLSEGQLLQDVPLATIPAQFAMPSLQPAVILSGSAPCVAGGCKC